MTWNQIVRKLAIGSVVGYISDGRRIEEQIAEAVGYGDEASCEVVISSSLGFQSQSEAESAIRNSGIGSSDFGKIRVMAVDRKGDHAIALIIVAANQRYLSQYCVQITREC